MSSTAYINVHTLKDGHTDTINALTFSPDGSQLASGSDDRSVVVWSVTKGTLLHRLFFDSCVDCVLWHPLQEDTLVVACEDGSLRQVHGFSLTHNKQYSINFGVVSTIYALDYHMKTGHLGAAIGTEVHVTKEITPNKYSPVTTLLPHPAEDFDPEDARHHAVTVQFDQSGKHLIVSYLHHGIVSWDIETCQCVWRINPPEGYPALGCCAVSPNDRDIVVHNFRDGLLSYHINAFNQARARRTHQFDRTPKSNVALQVGFLHSGSAVFCGTSTGNVCIWQKRTGEFFQQLPHDGDIVPAVASTRRGDRSYIATGCAFKGGDTYIKIWRARIPEVSSQTVQGSLSETILGAVKFDRPASLFDGILKLLTVTVATLSVSCVVWYMVEALPLIPWVRLGTAMQTVLVRCAGAMSSSVALMWMVIGRCYFLMRDTTWKAIASALEAIRLRLLAALGVPPNIQEILERWPPA